MGDDNDGSAASPIARVMGAIASAHNEPAAAPAIASEPDEAREIATIVPRTRPLSLIERLRSRTGKIMTGVAAGLVVMIAIVWFATRSDQSRANATEPAAAPPPPPPTAATQPPSPAEAPASPATADPQQPASPTTTTASEHHATKPAKPTGSKQHSKRRRPKMLFD